MGNWGADGQSVPVQAGTMMHELGHTLALTHGGLYFDNPGSSVASVEPNCKPNFQSVMNYLFQVDLLDGLPDYSSQVLGPPDGLVESSASPSNVLAGAKYSTTAWYAPNQPVGSPAKHHCDGSPLLTSDPDTFRLEGPSASIQWGPHQDINFDGIPNTTTASSPLRGFNDWAHVDLRQIGATGNNIPGAGIFGVGGGIFGVGGGIFGVGGGIFGVGGGIFGVGGGIFGVGGGIFGVGGGLGNGEITVEVANSVVRPPRTLSATLTPASAIQLSWTVPSFGTISAYKIYRAVNGGTASLLTTVTGAPPATSYLDTQVGCANYTYFVTAILAADGRESVPSNTTPSINVPCIFVGFLSPLKTAGDSSNSGTFEDDLIPIKWQITGPGGNYISALNFNTLGVYYSPLPTNHVCPLPSTVPPGTNLISLYSPSTGIAPYQWFSYDTIHNQFVFKWNAERFRTGCYIIELDLQDGQIKRTALRVVE